MRDSCVVGDSELEPFAGAQLLNLRIARNPPPLQVMMALVRINQRQLFHTIRLGLPCV